MFRTGANRIALRAISTPTPQAARCSINSAIQRAQWSSKSVALAVRRPQAVQSQIKPVAVALFRRHVSTVDHIDKKSEEKSAQKHLKPHPETVSMTSSTHPITSEVGEKDPEEDIDMMAGVKSDLRVIGETFSLQDVPRQAYVIGLAGVLPYLVTSVSTAYCAWEIHQNSIGSGFLLSGKAAELLLHVLEPLQIGYGAVIISFIGAIHWGFEWAGYGGYHGYKRYAIGVVAPAVAWPTILMPAVYGLTTQFMAFVFLYYVDTRATARGWVPTWYGTYRFVLTFIVGASIVLSLISKGEIDDRVQKLPSPVDRINAFRENAAEELAAEEEARLAGQKGQGGGDDDDDDEDK